MVLETVFLCPGCGCVQQLCCPPSADRAGDDVSPVQGELGAPADGGIPHCQKALMWTANAGHSTPTLCSPLSNAGYTDSSAGWANKAPLQGLPDDNKASPTAEGHKVHLCPLRCRTECDSLFRGISHPQAFLNSPSCLKKLNFQLFVCVCPCPHLGSNNKCFWFLKSIILLLKIINDFTQLYTLFVI